MPGMEQVETAICENGFFPAALKGRAQGRGLFKGDYLAAGLHAVYLAATGSAGASSLSMKPVSVFPALKASLSTISLWAAMVVFTPVTLKSSRARFDLATAISRSWSQTISLASMLS